ncbi:hypothetical protein QOT17_020627 [Balamuthia mandrillaris]
MEGGMMQGSAAGGGLIYLTKVGAGCRGRKATELPAPLTVMTEISGEATTVTTSCMALLPPVEREMPQKQILSEKEKERRKNICYKCGGFGHFAAMCPSRQGALDRDEPPCYKCNGKGHRQAFCPNNFIGRDTCYRCGIPGHHARGKNRVPPSLPVFPFTKETATKQ